MFLWPWRLCCLGQKLLIIQPNLALFWPMINMYAQKWLKMFNVIRLNLRISPCMYVINTISSHSQCMEWPWHGEYHSIILPCIKLLKKNKKTKTKCTLLSPRANWALCRGHSQTLYIWISQGYAATPHLEQGNGGPLQESDLVGKLVGNCLVAGS